MRITVTIFRSLLFVIITPFIVLLGTEFVGTASANNHKVAVLEFSDPYKSNVRQLVLDVIATISDVELLVTGDILLIADQSQLNIHSSADRKRLAEKIGIDFWIDGNVNNKWEAVFRVIDHNEKILTEAVITGQNRNKLRIAVVDELWARIGHYISNTAKQEREAWLKEQARQEYLAGQRELASTKALARQQEIIRQKELVLQREELRLSQLDGQRSIAVQKGIARNDEIRRQKKLVIEREREAQQAFLKQQKIKKQKELEAQRTYAREQSRKKRQAFLDQRSRHHDQAFAGQQKSMSSDLLYSQQIPSQQGQDLTASSATAPNQNRNFIAPSNGQGTMQQSAPTDDPWALLTKPPSANTDLTDQSAFSSGNQHDQAPPRLMPVGDPWAELTKPPANAPEQFGQPSTPDNGQGAEQQPDVEVNPYNQLSQQPTKNTDQYDQAPSPTNGQGTSQQPLPVGDPWAELTKPSKTDPTPYKQPSSPNYGQHHNRNAPNTGATYSQPSNYNSHNTGQSAGSSNLAYGSQPTASAQQRRSSLSKKTAMKRSKKRTPVGKRRPISLSKRKRIQEQEDGCTIVHLNRSTNDSLFIIGMCVFFLLFYFRRSK